VPCQFLPLVSQALTTYSALHALLRKDPQQLDLSVLQSEPYRLPTVSMNMANDILRGDVLVTKLLQAEYCSG
jgi:hypothetical protein